MAAEETRKPSRNIPIAHTLVILITSIALFVLSSLITLSHPADLLLLDAPLLHVFENLRVRNAKFFLGVGCACGLVLAIVMQLNYAERMVYSMARDKLLPVSNEVMDNERFTRSKTEQMRYVSIAGVT